MPGFGCQVYEAGAFAPVASPRSLWRGFFKELAKKDVQSKSEISTRPFPVQQESTVKNPQANAPAISPGGMAGVPNLHSRDEGVGCLETSCQFSVVGSQLPEE